MQDMRQGKLQLFFIGKRTIGDGEREVAFFSAKRLDRRNMADLTPPDSSGSKVGGLHHGAKIPQNDLTT